MSQTRIFVSHSSQDKAFADALVKTLREAGADVWYDETNLGAEHLLDTIQREIVARPVFLVVLSKAAFASEWVRDECQWAYNLKKREPNRMLLPVVAQPIAADDFNDMLFLEHYRRVEGPGNVPYPATEAIERTLRLVLGATPPPASSQPSLEATRLVDRGKALMAQDAYDSAIDLFEYATRVAPTNFSVWFNLGAAQNAMGYWEDSLASFQRALHIRPNDGPALSQRGKALLGVREFDLALETYERALKLNDRVAIRWAGKGIALKWLYRLDEALEAINQALTLDPDYGEAWAAKSNVLWLLEKQTQAMDARKHALRYNEDAPLPWSYKAITWRALHALGSEQES